MTRGKPWHTASFVLYSNDSDSHKKTLSFIGFYPGDAYRYKATPNRLIIKQQTLLLTFSHYFVVGLFYLPLFYQVIFGNTVKIERLRTTFGQNYHAVIYYALFIIFQ